MLPSLQGQLKFYLLQHCPCPQRPVTAPRLCLGWIPSSLWTQEREHGAEPGGPHLSPAHAAHSRPPRRSLESRNRGQEVPARGRQGFRLGRPSRQDQRVAADQRPSRSQILMPCKWPRRRTRPRPSLPPRPTAWPRPARTPATLWAPELRTSCGKVLLF